jgi:5,10-methylenetetrahydrofolate reductase
LTDLLRSRLARRAWTVSVEVVTPSPSARAARARVVALADAVRTDDRVAALTLTDRTIANDADPVTLSPDVAARSGKAPLVHLAGKGRDAAGVIDALQRVGSGSVLLTGGDPSSGVEAERAGKVPERAGKVPERAGVSPGARDSIAMLRLARTHAPHLLPLAVLAPGRALDEAWGRTVAKRDAGAAAFVAQVSWDLDGRATIARWQARLGVPVLGAVMLLTRGRLEFLARHRIGGIEVPPGLRRRAEGEDLDAALRRLALDLMALRRLGYTGAHVSGVLTPAFVARVLDDAERLEASLGDDWRAVWREAAGMP